MLFVGLPVAVGVFVLGDLVVQVVLGEKWLPAVPLLKVLAIYGIIRSSVGGAFSLTLALGRPAAVTAVAAARFVVLVALLYWVLPGAGPIGAAWASVIAAATGLALNSLVIARILRFTFARASAGIWRTVVSSVAMAAVLAACHAQWPAADGALSALVQLLALILLGAATYLLTCAALWAVVRFPDGAERHVMRLMDHGLARMLSAINARPPTAL
jgi:O-antigen/teichoic acid export membrane protein